MDDILKKLEKVFGKVFLSHTIFYLTTFKSGISEQELKDFLNLDHAIHDEIFENGKHSEDKEFLSNHAQILRNYLASYLQETEEDGTQVIAWRNTSYSIFARRYYMYASLKSFETTKT